MVRAWGALAILSVAGCSAGVVRPLDVAALKRSGPRAVAVAVSEVPDLYTESAGIPLLPVGPLAMAVAGTASVRHASAKADTLRAMGVEDPAVMVRGLVVAAREYNSLYLDYVGTLRLIDGRSGAVLAEGFCSTPGSGSRRRAELLRALVLPATGSAAE